MPAIDPIHMPTAGAASSPPRRVHRAPPPPPLTPCALPPRVLRQAARPLERHRVRRLAPLLDAVQARPSRPHHRRRDAAMERRPRRGCRRHCGRLHDRRPRQRRAHRDGRRGPRQRRRRRRRRGSRSSGSGGRSSAPRVAVEIRAAAASAAGGERLLAAVLQFFGDQKGAFARCFDDGCLAAGGERSREGCGGGAHPEGVRGDQDGARVRRP